MLALPDERGGSAQPPARPLTSQGWQRQLPGAPPARGAALRDGAPWGKTALGGGTSPGVRGGGGREMVSAALGAVSVPAGAAGIPQPLLEAPGSASAWVRARRRAACDARAETCLGWVWGLPSPLRWGSRAGAAPAHFAEGSRWLRGLCRAPCAAPGSRWLHLPLSFPTVCLPFSPPNLRKTKPRLLGKRRRGRVFVQVPPCLRTAGHKQNKKHFIQKPHVQRLQEEVCTDLCSVIPHLANSM